MTKTARGKRFLLLDFTNNYDGQQFIYRLFEKMDGDYDVWTLGQENPKVELEFGEKNRFVPCPRTAGLSREALNLKAMRAAVREAKDIDPDVVFYHTYGLWNLAVLFALRNRAEQVSALHHIVQFPGDRHRVLMDAGNWATVRLSDKAVVFSDYLAEKARNKFGSSGGKVFSTNYLKGFEEFDPPEETGEVLFFGRLMEYKGLDYLPGIIEQCPEFLFNIVGKAGAGCEEKVSALKKYPNVVLDESYVAEAEMAEYFHRAEMVILPYRHAGLSGVLLDSYRFSRPAVAFAVDVVPEMIRDGESGYLVPPGDVEEFCLTLKAHMSLSNEEKVRVARQAWEFGYGEYAIANDANVARFIEVLER